MIHNFSYTKSLKKLHALQAKKIHSSMKSVSLSRVVNEVLKKASSRLS